jgi:hypothetical protein
MFELPVASSLGDFDPAVVFQRANQIADFHRCQLSLVIRQLLLPLSYK